MCINELFCSDLKSGNSCILHMLTRSDRKSNYHSYKRLYFEQGVILKEVYTCTVVRVPWQR